MIFADCYDPHVLLFIPFTRLSCMINRRYFELFFIMWYKYFPNHFYKELVFWTCLPVSYPNDFKKEFNYYSMVNKIFPYTLSLHTMCKLHKLECKFKNYRHYEQLRTNTSTSGI